MAEQPEDLRALARETVQTLRTMEGHLKGTQAEIQALPFFARGLPERDIANATGRGFGDWIAATAKLRSAIEPLTEADTGAAGALQAIAAEQPKLAALRGYLAQAPDRLKSAPPGILKPQKKAEMVAQLTQQAAGLHTLETQLAAMAAHLRPAG